MDELLDEYARILLNIEQTQTSAGYYTYLGVLAEFIRKAQELIPVSCSEAHPGMDVYHPEGHSVRRILKGD